jgi:hypothetical protein
MGQLETKIDSKFNPLNYSTVYNLIPHYEKNNMKNYFKSIFIANLLQSYFDPTTTAKLTYKHLNNLKYNMVTLSEWSSPEGPISHQFWNSRAKTNFAKITTNSYATGVFTLLAICNHSCDANCAFVYKNFGILLTLKDVAKNEEFRICYKQPWDRMEVVERKKYLFENYKFNCDCWACIENVDKSSINENDQGGIVDLKIGENYLEQCNFEKAFDFYLSVLKEVKNLDVKSECVLKVLEFGRRVVVNSGMW